MSSKRKYNPNKLINIQRAKAGLLYEFDMTFCIEDVNRKIYACREANVLADDAYCPEWLVIETYKQQDLIIALKMSHAELMNGCEVKVNRGAGIKTRWKGLQDEMIKNWETETMPDNYSLVESQVFIKAQARFHDIKMYNEHNLLLKLRDHGNLIDTLKVWV